MDAATPNSRFPELNLDPALAEAVDSAPADQIIEGILRLEAPNDVPPLFTVVSQFNRICTGRFRAAHAWSIRRHPNVISFKAARPLGVSYDAEDLIALDLPRETQTPPGPSLPFSGRGCIVAALDFGLDFAHPNFLNPDGTTRLVSFWHQGATYDPAHPNPYGYGRIFSNEEINAALRAPDPYEALNYHPSISDTGHGSHGTHTLDIAAGNGRATGTRAAPASNADLMFIHLSTPRLGVAGDLGDSVRMLEALDHVERTARGRPWVVNLSVGRTAGSHDGTSPVEQGMHELLRLGPGRVIVQSAGNYRSANLAAEGWCRDGEYRDLEWIVDAADTTDNELDVWYSGKDRFVIAIRPPQGTSFVEVKLGEVADIVHEGTVVGRLYHRRNDPNNRDNHAEVFLYSGAPPGVWTLRLNGEYVISGRFHAWIERDLARPGAQSRFDEKITSRSYTLGTIATSPLVITVGAYDANAAGAPLARFSSCGPTRDERRDKPELLAPGVDVVAARSIPRGASTQEGLVIARSGTSMAAPHVTGTVAAMFEAAGRPVSIDEIRDCLRRSAEPVTNVENVVCSGWGRLNVAGAIDEILRLKDTQPVSESPVDSVDLMPAPFFATASEQRNDVLNEGGAMLNLEAVTEIQEQSEHTHRNMRRRRQSEISFLHGLLSGFGDQIYRTDFSPAELFRAVLSDQPFMKGASEILEVLAMPLQHPQNELRPGDWLLRAVPGTGDVGHLSVLSSGNLLTATELSSKGIAAESSRPGYYGLVIEAGAFPHSPSRPFARRLLDSRGRVAQHSVLLRPKYPYGGNELEFPPDEWPVEQDTGSTGTSSPPTRLPKVMFEFDVHYGFRDIVDEKLGQTVPFDRLTKHDKKHDFFNVKRDVDRLEIGTERFTLDSAGLANLQQVKKNIKEFADLLQKGCSNALPRTNIKIPSVTGHPRLFPLPNARSSTASLLVHKLHINKKFPASKLECDVWASPQAHITIPLAKVGVLIDEIKKSIGKSSGKALTGGPGRRMGERSDHLYKAKEGVESLRGAMVTWKHKLSNGVLVDQSTFTDQLSGFLMLQASYLWVRRLWQRDDYESYGKGHLPINVKTPFPEIFSVILTPTEQLIYKELLAGLTIRYRMFGLIKDYPTLADGAELLFPPPVGSSLTWDNLLDWTLGLSSPIGSLPGGGNSWPASETSPLVALELRRIGFSPMSVSKWEILIDTIIDLTKRLN